MKIVSLFSGAGGLDLGLLKTGHEIVWANDIFLDAADTYKVNIGDHIDTRDICTIPSTEIPDCDAIVGGFPCQGFSVANWGRTLEDPRNRLFREMVRVVHDKQPRYFVAENVKGLLSMGEGKVLSEIEAAFAGASELGYRVRHQLVNAADYGVPQLRMRVIIVGARRDQPDFPTFPPPPTHANPSVARMLKLKPWVTVGDALAHFPEPENGQHIPNHQNSRYKLRFNGHLGHRFVDPAKPAQTVTARGDDRGGVVVLHHPGNHRRMTARELAAVQSFPDDFVFSGTKTSAYRQIANAVPPLLGEAIGAILVKAEEASIARKTEAA
ncbi:MAG: DNA cytosine methyltransferase [Nitrososphaerota archaeon]|jgi:DNA (cytosine-5)-methyltransferase 1|nr:DNA cytosine methyltransferase [Nitrososphaerota archaeon]